MPETTIEELQSKLKSAHQRAMAAKESGDTEAYERHRSAASRFAAAIRASGEVTASPSGPPTDRRAEPQELGDSLLGPERPWTGGIPGGLLTATERVARPALNMAGGMGETAAAVGTNMYGMAQGGIGAGYELARSALTGEEGGLDRAAMIAREIPRQTAYQPRTPSGRKAMSLLGDAGDYWTKNWARPAGEGVAEVGGPLAGAGAETIMELAPDIALARRGVERTGRALYGEPRGEILPRREARSRVRDAQRGAKAEGVDLSARGQPLRDQLTESAERRLAATGQKGEGLEGMQAAQRDAYQRERARTGGLYDQADQMGAGVTLERLRPAKGQFLSTAKKRGWDLKRMPYVRDRLAEMDRIVQRYPDNAVMRLKAIDDFRKRINANRQPDPPGGDTSPQNLALDEMRRALDDRISYLFERDMISGSPDAVRMWSKARKEYGSFKDLFKPGKSNVSPATARIMRDILRKDMSVHDVRNLIVGSSAAAPKRFSTEILSRLSETLSGDKWDALRKDLQLDIIEPLMPADQLTKSGVRRFVKNTTELLNNRDYADLILTPEEKKGLIRLRDIGRAEIRAKEPTQYDNSIIKPTIQWFVGHGIHKGSAKMSLVERLVNWGKSKGNRREYLNEMLGFDPDKTGIGSGPIVAAGAQHQPEDPPGSQTR